MNGNGIMNSPGQVVRDSITEARHGRQQRRHHTRGVTDRVRQGHPAALFDDGGKGVEVHLEPAVLLGHQQSEHAHLHECVPGRAHTAVAAAESGVAADLPSPRRGDVRGSAGVSQEGPDRGGELGVFLGWGETHLGYESGWGTTQLAALRALFSL